MAESRDPAFKLFGKMIHIPVGVGVWATIGEEFVEDDGKVPSNNEASPEPNDNTEEAPTSTEEEQQSDESIDFPNEEKMEQKSSSPENSKADDENNESNNDPQNKSNKKPDKILPCPRCKSMETKFCYYNNYNVNQPRHFCKNCQRYWTAGGSMRNVPVGAGRRKSKCSASNQHFRHITIPDCVRAESELVHHLQPLTSNGMVLSFGSDAPLYESMASVMTNKNQKLEEESSGSPNSDEQAKVSSDLNCYGILPNVSDFSGSLWHNQWTHRPFAFPFYPIPAYWSMPWMPAQMSSSPSSGSLGKHSREGNLLNQKRMKIDVPCGQPWDSGMMRTDLVGGGKGLFKAFQSAGDHKIDSTEVSQFLLANPAALSRSFNFHERS